MAKLILGPDKSSYFRVKLKRINVHVLFEVPSEVPFGVSFGVPFGVPWDLDLDLSLTIIASKTTRNKEEDIVVSTIDDAS